MKNVVELEPEIKVGDVVRFKCSPRDEFWVVCYIYKWWPLRGQVTVRYRTLSGLAVSRECSMAELEKVK